MKWILAWACLAAALWGESTGEVLIGFVDYPVVTYGGKAITLLNIVNFFAVGTRPHAPPDLGGQYGVLSDYHPDIFGRTEYAGA